MMEQDRALDPLPREQASRSRLTPARLKLIRVLAVLFIIVLSVLVVLWGDRLAGLGAYGYPGLFLLNLLASATLILPAPGLALALAAGATLNPYLVGLAVGSGSTLGELTGYMAGYGGSAVVKDRERFRRVQEWMGRRGFLTIFVLSAIPNPLFDLAGISAGMLHYPIWKFLLPCWLGKTVKALAIAYLGSGLFGTFAHWLG